MIGKISQQLQRVEFYDRIEFYMMNMLLPAIWETVSIQLTKLKQCNAAFRAG